MASDTGNYSPQFHPYDLKDLSAAEIGRLDDFSVEFRNSNSGVQCVDWVAGCLFGISRDVVRRIGYLDESFDFAYHEENEYCLRAREAGFLCLIDNSTFCYHVGGQTMKTAKRKALIALARNTLRLGKKHGWGTLVRMNLNWHFSRKKEGRDPEDFSG
jgi:GT2 family glycosyltransferase